jgi:hypothetical protein
MTDGCSECGATGWLDQDGKCPLHRVKVSPLHRRACGCSVCQLASVFAACVAVLSPSNENVKRGDVIGCVRDMAQMAMSVKEGAQS